MSVIKTDFSSYGRNDPFSFPCHFGRAISPATLSFRSGDKPLPPRHFDRAKRAEKSRPKARISGRFKAAGRPAQKKNPQARPADYFYAEERGEPDDIVFPARLRAWNFFCCGIHKNLRAARALTFCAGGAQICFKSYVSPGILPHQLHFLPYIFAADTLTLRCKEVRCRKDRASNLRR